MNVAQMVGVVLIGLILAAWSGCNGCSAKKAVDTANTAVATAGSANDKAEEAKKKAVEFEDWRKKKLFPWSPEFKGAEEVLENHDKEIKELKKRPATVVTVTSATVTPAPAPAPTPARVVSTADLIRDLGSPDAKGVAIIAAERLYRRNDATPEVVDAFITGNAEMKRRVKWVISRMGEPCRLWMVSVLDNPDNFRPAVLSAVKELMGELPIEPTPKSPTQVKPAKVPAAKPPVLGVYLHHHDGEVKMGGNIILAGNVTTTGNVKVTGQVNGQVSGTFRHEGKDVPVCWDSSNNRWVQLRN